MLQITIPATELWDEAKGEFTYAKEQTLQLEHSLVSISKWESKWQKAFLGNQEKTNEEMLDYIRCMTITQNVDPLTYYRLTRENIRQINEYISSPMSATVITHLEQTKPNREVVTSELIYYWMLTLNIPLECQKWHLSRLFKLIDVCNVKNAPQKKMSRAEIMKQNAKINAARRQKLKTKG